MQEIREEAKIQDLNFKAELNQFKRDLSDFKPLEHKVKHSYSINDENLLNEVLSALEGFESNLKNVVIPPKIEAIIKKQHNFSYDTKSTKHLVNWFLFISIFVFVAFSTGCGYLGYRLWEVEKEKKKEVKDVRNYYYQYEQFMKKNAPNTHKSFYK
jgi:hypothetical protein